MNNTPLTRYEAMAAAALTGLLAQGVPVEDAPTGAMIAADDMIRRLTMRAWQQAEQDAWAAGATMAPCVPCSGSGRVIEHTSGDGHHHYRDDCPDCRGTGKAPDITYYQEAPE